MPASMEKEEKRMTVLVEKQPIDVECKGVVINNAEQCGCH